MLLDSDGNGLSVGFTRGAAIILITTNWIIIWRSLGARQTRRIPGGETGKGGSLQSIYVSIYVVVCGLWQHRPCFSMYRFHNKLSHMKVCGECNLSSQ